MFTQVNFRGINKFDDWLKESASNENGWFATKRWASSIA